MYTYCNVFSAASLSLKPNPATVSTLSAELVLAFFSTWGPAFASCHCSNTSIAALMLAILSAAFVTIYRWEWNIIYFLKLNERYINSIKKSNIPLALSNRKNYLLQKFSKFGTHSSTPAWLVPANHAPSASGKPGHALRAISAFPPLWPDP